jgi:hypothetical protein
MLIWLVMHINQLMFSPIADGTTISMLQAFSFVEILVELVVVVGLIVMSILERGKK